MDTLLYGHNTEERVVAVQQLNDREIRLFIKTEGRIVHKDMEFFPFFFLADESLIKEFPKKFWLKELAGKNYYRYIAAFSRWSEMWEAVHFILRQHNKNRSPHIHSYQDLKELLIRSDPVRQFLLQSGINLFKGMKFEELVRLHIDMECVPPPMKKKEKKETERILVITLVDGGGKEYVLRCRSASAEKGVLEKCISLIKDIDPDIIDGYNLYGGIMPAIVRACERNGVSFSIGRDGSDMRAPAGGGTSAFGENEWFPFEVSGRHLVDIAPVAESEMGTKRSEQVPGIHQAAKYFGIPFISEETGTRSAIGKNQREIIKRTEERSRQNAHIAHRLSDLLHPFIFEMAKICPFDYGMLMRMGTNARIESLILREYVRRKYSIPKPAEGSRIISLPAEIYKAGVFSDVFYIELEGLHPTIMLEKNVGPETDSLDVFRTLLKKFYSLYRGSAESTDRSMTGPEPSLQSKIWKYFLDSFHIYLGSAKGLFNDHRQAEVVITASRDILKEITQQIELFNAAIIQSDGQGFFVLMPDNIVGETNRNTFFERLSGTLLPGIHLAPKKHYQKMFSYRKNNYALLDTRMNILIKGNGIISRNMERFQSIFIHRFIECLLTSDFKRMHHTYATAYTQITAHKWNVADFCRIDAVKTDTETYQRERESGSVPPSPAMEAALRSGIFVKPNQRIAYYNAGTEANAEFSRSARLAEEWNPSIPDENTPYYLARLHESASKFREFFEPTAFDRILSMDEIFGFSEEGIRILSLTVTTESAETRPEIDDYGIWLDES
jgi:DNA polymerase I